jgi:hypothetical protein
LRKLLWLLARGWSPDEICRQHPIVRPAEVRAVMVVEIIAQEEIVPKWDQARQSERGQRAQAVR